MSVGFIKSLGTKRPETLQNCKTVQLLRHFITKNVICYVQNDQFLKTFSILQVTTIRFLGHTAQLLLRDSGVLQTPLLP